MQPFHLTLDVHGRRPKIVDAASPFDSAGNEL
jgi:hypothetical protein